jgi:hypothetical protein
MQRLVRHVPKPPNSDDDDDDADNSGNGGSGSSSGSASWRNSYGARMQKARARRSSAVRIHARLSQ